MTLTSGGSRVWRKTGIIKNLLHFKMTRKAVKRILKKRRQIKKQIKHKTDQQPPPPQRPMPPPMIGFAHQQYGNPDFAIQQLRNQNQMTTDQMNNYRVVLDAMTKEKEKNQAAIKELKHQLKDAKAQHDQSKLDLDIAQDQASSIERLQKQSEYYLDKLHSIEQQILKEDGNGEVMQQTRALQEEKNRLHDAQIQNIKAENEIKANTIAAEVKRVKDETKILANKNDTMLEYIDSDEFKNPENFISAAYLKQMKEQEKNDLINKWVEMHKQMREFKKQADNDNTDAMIEQLKNSLVSTEQYKSVLVNENQILHNKELIYKELLEEEVRVNTAINKLQLENAKLQAKYQSLKAQPEVYAEVKKLQKQLAQLTAQKAAIINKLKMLNDVKQARAEYNQL